MPPLHAARAGRLGVALIPPLRRAPLLAAVPLGLGLFAVLLLACRARVGAVVVVLLRVVLGRGRRLRAP